VWVSDGTAAGTRIIAEIAPGSESSNPFGFAEVGGRVVFWADAGRGPALYAADPATGATAQISDVRFAWNPSPDFVALGDGRLAFAGWEARSGLEPWVTDGTVEGTGRVVDLADGALSSGPASFATSSGRVFFAADDGATGRELYALALDEFVPTFTLPPGSVTTDPLPGYDGDEDSVAVGPDASSRNEGMPDREDDQAEKTSEKGSVHGRRSPGVGCAASPGMAPLAVMLSLWLARRRRA
jgi:uncharacterized protein (TIGR03382 family)